MNDATSIESTDAINDRSGDTRLAEVVGWLEPFLVDWIDTQRLRTGVPGVQVAIRRGRELLSSFAVGWADEPSRVPLATRHAFRIASHSKTFTATAVMQLAEAGALRLDDTLGHWLPELDDVPAGEVTLRELLSHQAGVLRDGEDANFWQLARRFNDRDQLIAELRRDLVFAPNTHFHYTNIGYSALGLVVEQVTGRSWHDVVLELVAPLRSFVDDDLVLGPELGHGDDGVEYASGHAMQAVGVDGGDPSKLAPTELARIETIAPVDTHAEGAATGCWANAEATTAWLAAHALGTDLLLSDASKRLMQRKESTIVEAGQTRWYGLGWIMREIGQRFVIGHSGGFPGHITQTWGDPATGLSVSVLTNRNGSSASEWATTLVKLIDHAAALVGTSTDAPDDRFRGRFTSLWGSTHLVPLPGAVLALSSEAADPTGSAVSHTIVDAGTLLAQARDGFSSFGEELRVARDEAGEITSITTTGITSWTPPLFASMRSELLSGSRLRALETSVE
ncbi:serine hydrolase domain-containing protein [Aestuariimicrobium sp. T2.26MG-19.2B]|uniref:serine hydrolase domain-containing protein n=1 Tax=Aestuariimicrobium sp. T2.26MG-19.2B TaxID=3040679 RepID=UPI0024778EBA|nr:serine hydrolase domain-containing protein [Aestuariimicrobium sp. T2.26MG-19.2B]CAI9406881.1 D-aminopeptidase [Aestuariimicrobium sp. T2.26MG-19.2B]